MELKGGYKQTEVGVIPDDWYDCTFQDVLTGFSSGMTPYRGNPDFYTGNIPWVTSGELNYNIILDTVEKITDDAVVKTNLKVLPVGTFLMAITGLEAAGTRGSCAITGIKATTNQSCMALFPQKDKIILDYFYHYYVRYGDVLAFKFCQGTKQQSYTGKIVKILPINLPSTEIEQTAIANALSDADALIQSLTSLIAKKRQIKQGVMQTLLNPYENDRIKAGWGFISYEKAFNFLSTASFSRAELNKSEECGYIHYGDIHTLWNEFIDFKKHPVPGINFDKAKGYALLNEGDIIMADASEDYAGIGKSVEVKEIGSRKVISGLHTFLLRDKAEHFINGYKGYIHLSAFVKKQFDRLATGLKVYGVSKANLKLIEIPLPPKNEQIRMATIFSDMDASITALETKLTKAQQIKQGMMQALLTGRIRLINNEEKIRESEWC